MTPSIIKIDVGLGNIAYFDVGSVIGRDQIAICGCCDVSESFAQSWKKACQAAHIFL